MTHPLTASACAACRSEPEIASRALRSFDATCITVATAATYRAARSQERERRRLRREMVHAALENERQVRAVGVSPLLAMLAWQVAWLVLKPLIERLWSYWWAEKNRIVNESSAGRGE